MKNIIENRKKESIKMYGIGYGGGFGFFMMFGFFLLLVLVIIGIYFIVHYFTNSNVKEGTRSGEKALEILHERYAQGEIDEEEYIQKKRSCESYKVEMNKRGSAECTAPFYMSLKE